MRLINSGDQVVPPWVVCASEFYRDRAPDDHLTAWHGARRQYLDAGAQSKLAPLQATAWHDRTRCAGCRDLYGFTA